MFIIMTVESGLIVTLYWLVYTLVGVKTGELVHTAKAKMGSGEDRR